MPNYTFHIRKADHVGDLHVHVYYNEGQKRRSLGRYRLPTLEPVFSGEPELNGAETAALRAWLAQPQQLRKLQDCLQSSVFDLHRVARLVPQMAAVEEENGETFITVKIPVSRRIPLRDEL